MLRQSLDYVTRLFGWLRRRRRVRRVSAAGPVKVNLGSSLSVAPGWINVDGSLSAFFASWPRPAQRIVYRLTSMQAQYSEAEYLRLLGQHRFFHHNLEYGIPLPDSCADYIFTSHFLEHLSKQHGQRLLREAFRVLKPGGLLRISVPDLERTMAAYQAGRREEAVDDIYAYSELGYFARHRYMYDFELLRERLDAIGFVDIQRRAFQQGRVPDLEALDNRPESLFVEATKPSGMRMEDGR